MRISTPIYMAIHNRYSMRDTCFYVVSILPDWRYILSCVKRDNNNIPKIIVMDVSVDNSPRGIVVYDGCYANVSAPVNSDKVVHIELSPIRDSSVPCNDKALVARGCTGYKYKLHGDRKVYYSCVSAGCGCGACKEEFSFGIACSGECDYIEGLFSIDAACVFDMFMLKMYYQAVNSTNSCRCWLLNDKIYKSHVLLNKYCNSAIDCMFNCSPVHNITRFVPMIPLKRITWDAMIQKLQEYVEDNP